MKIRNPFPSFKHVKATWKQGDKEVVAVFSDARVIEVDEEAEVRIDAIRRGKSDSEAVQTLMWTKADGISDIKQFMARRELKAKQKAFEVEQKAVREKKLDKASNGGLRRSAEKRPSVKHARDL